MYSRIVYVDVETTGLNWDDQIVQLSAVDDKGEQFDVYMMPNVRIDERAAAVNGFKVTGKFLYHNDNRVSTVRRREAMRDFLDYLKPGPVILLAHNGTNLDFPKLIAEFSQRKMFFAFQDVIKGFCDSLPLIKKVLPNRSTQRGSFKLTTLYDYYVGGDLTEFAHSSLVDALILRDTIKRLGIRAANVEKSCQLFDDEVAAYNRRIKNAMNRESLKRVFKDSLSNVVIRKMAAAGISWDSLADRYDDQGAEGVYNMLSRNIRGHPLVTKNRKILSIIVDVIENYGSTENSEENSHPSESDDYCTTSDSDCYY